MSQIETLLKERILVLDGAMGTMIQAYDFKEADFRAKRFKDHPVPLQGNNDLLTLTQPEAIKSIHAKYFEAGAGYCRNQLPFLLQASGWPIMKWRIGSMN